MRAILKWAKRLALGVSAMLGVVALVLLLEYSLGGKMGIFSGSKPINLGFSNQQFALPSWKPNTVLSTVAASDTHYIAPIAFKGDADAAWARMQAVVKASPTATVQAAETKGSYLYAQFKSAGLGFIDDVELAIDRNANVIHVKSASRLGVRDFGVNRARVEALRAAFASAV